MGSKGNRKIGSFAKDYSSVEPQWIEAVLINDEQLKKIIIEGKIEFTRNAFLKLKNEIESYIYLASLQKLAPHIGGSGRCNDFFNQHILSLASIYKSQGGKITLGRLNPSRKNINGLAKSKFLSFCEKINSFMPPNLKRIVAIDSCPNHGFTRALRRVLSN